MELILSAACEGAHKRPDGRLDLIGVFDALSAPGFPARQDQMTVVFIMEWPPEQAGRQEFRADLVDAAGKKVLTIEGHTDVAPGDGPGRPRTELIMPMEKVIFPHEGAYHFRLEVAGETHTAIPLILSEAAEES